MFRRDYNFSFRLPEAFLKIFPFIINSARKVVLSHSNKNNFPVIFLPFRMKYVAQSHQSMSVREVVSGGWSERIPYAELLAFNDEQLIEEIRAGNTDAFAVVFKRYHRLVHLVALQVLRDAGEAEDLTQTVFLQIYRSLGQFDLAKGSLKGWLLLHAQRRSLNRRNYLLVRQFHNQAELTAVDEESGLWSPRQSPIQETNQVTNEVLSALPEAQRQTIEMYFFEGLSLKEIAERREETFSNVRHHYYRGLERLRFYLEKGIPREAADATVVRPGEA